MVIKKDISSIDIADRAEEVLSALLNNNKIEIENSSSLSSDAPKRQRSWKKSILDHVSWILGLLLMVIGVLLTIYPMTDIVMTERLEMNPNLPGFKLWYTPDPEIICKVFIFNVTNSKEFESGVDNKMKIVEIGPIMYREILTHSDAVFHPENSTMSYTVTRTAEFIPERNEPGILNQTIIVPNIALLGMAAFLQNYMLSYKFGFRMMSSSDSIFLNVSIENYLWNLTTPALHKAETLVPFMVPTNNAGPLATVYKDFSDRANVNIGKAHGNRDFFKINTFNYIPTVMDYKYQDSDCYASLMNSTEGAIYGQYISKSDILHYWRKTVCRPIPLYYQEEIQMGQVMGYKFVTKSNMYDRIGEPEMDCYDNFNGITYPDGLSDAARCYDDLPVAMSLPHFLDRDGYWNDKLEGLKPSRENHMSYAIIEPLTGIPLEQCARAQSNLIIPKLSGFSTKITKFSNMVLPLMWLEYRLEKLTPMLDFMLYVLVNILPIGQYIISVGLLVLGSFLVFRVVRRSKWRSFFKLYKAKRNDETIPEFN